MNLTESADGLDKISKNGIDKTARACIFSITMTRNANYGGQRKRKGLGLTWKGCGLQKKDK